MKKLALTLALVVLAGSALADQCGPQSPSCGPQPGTGGGPGAPSGPGAPCGPAGSGAPGGPCH